MWRFKENPVKRKIERGELTIGAYARWFVHGLDMNLIYMFAQEGYDFVVIDTEHTPYYGMEACATAVIAAEAAGITPFIRVAHNEPILITKALEIGAYGVWVPHVDSKEECEQAVGAAKYPPAGARGMSRGYPADGYGYADWDKFWRFSNKETMVTVLPLESRKGIDNIEEIISVKGLGMISLSVGDIAQCLGHPGQPGHPEVMEVRDRVLALCQEKGMPVYLPGSYPKLWKYYYDKGVRTFLTGPNIRRCIRENLSNLRKTIGVE